MNENRELTYGDHQNAKRVMEKESEPDKTNTEKIMSKEQKKPQRGGKFNGCTCDVDCQCESHFNYKKSSNFNGGYIKASQEAYDLLVEARNASTETQFPKDCKFIEIIGNTLFFTKYFETLINPDKQLFINNGKLSWGEPIHTSSIDDLNELQIAGEEQEPFEVTQVESTVVDKIDFASDVKKITGGLAEMLISKNKKYGNSAFKPKRIFSKANATEQILVRIDDKLSRIANQSDLEDEDVIEDLLGDLVLLKIAKSKS